RAANPGNACVSEPVRSESWMTYVVTEACIKCKYTDCVEVCPVDCFYEGENMLVIHPDECIDCGVCEPECPADAIKPDTETGLEKWLAASTQCCQRSHHNDTTKEHTEDSTTTPRRTKPPPTQKNARVWKASSRSIFPGNPGLATDSPT